MYLLFAGIALSIFGSLPPGLISLTVSQTSIRHGLAAALTLALGAALAEFFQAWAAVLLTDWFLSHPMAERGFRWMAVLIFLTLAVHLIFFAKAPQAPQAISRAPLSGQFAKGVVVSVFNLLAIPYWFVYCGWLRVEGWWQEGLTSTLLFSAGVTIGTLCTLGLYAWMGQIILQRAGALARNANLVVGLIFLGLGLKTLAELVIK